MADNENQFDLTAPGRLVFPVVTQAQLDRGLKYYEEQKAKGNKEQKEPSWETQLLLPKDHPDLPAINAIIDALVTENFEPWEFPKHSGKFSSIEDVGEPLKSGTHMSASRAKARAAQQKDNDRAYLDGGIVLVARSKNYKPSLAATINGKMIDVNEGNEALYGKKFFAGAQALLSVRFAWYNASPMVPSGGVTAYLQMVACNGLGEPFPGTEGFSAAARFGQHVGHVKDVDPTARRRRSYEEDDREI